MPEVIIDGVRYAPAQDLDNLKRWHVEALDRVRSLESAMESTIKLMAAAKQEARSLSGECASLREALGFYADVENWMLRKDERGGYLGSVMSEDKGALAKLTLREGACETSKPTEDSPLPPVSAGREAGGEKPVPGLPVHPGPQPGAEEEPPHQEQVQRPEV